MTTGCLFSLHGLPTICKWYLRISGKIIINVKNLISPDLFFTFQANFFAILILDGNSSSVASQDYDRGVII